MTHIGKRVSEMSKTSAPILKDKLLLVLKTECAKPAFRNPQSAWASVPSSIRWG